MSSFLTTVVVDFDTEDNHRADGGYYVGDYKGPVAKSKTLDNEENTAETEHTERRKGNAVGVAGLYRHDSLGHISEYHADTGSIADNCDEKVIHNKTIF